MSDEELRAAVAKVVAAIKVEGRSPYHHRRLLAKHRAEWPALWAALDHLVR